MNLTSFFPVLVAQATETPADDTPLGVVIGFLLLLGFLILILTRGAPRSQPEVVDPQTPDRWKDSPVYAENRRKAAAAAVARHLNSSQETSS